MSVEQQLKRRRARARLLEFSAKTPALSDTPAPIGRPGGPGLWHVKGMGFPPYFQNVRNALIRSGHSVAEASQITWKAIRSWAKGKTTGGEKGKIHPEVRAAALRALAGIARDQARAHAQHAHTNSMDELILLQFARDPHTFNRMVVELAGGDPYHAPAGPGGGRFTTGPSSSAPKGPPQAAATQPTPAQKKADLQKAAALTAQANNLRQQAAKLTLQINALAALIAQETLYLNTAAQGTTTSGTGSTTGTGTGTTTSTTSTGTSTTTGTGTTTAPSSTYNQPFTSQLLQQNLAQYQQLTAKRDALLAQAQKDDQQAATYRQLAAG